MSIPLTDESAMVAGMETIPAIRSRATRYDERTKALAYEVYAHRAGGDMVETIRLLAELVEPPLSEKTIYDWRDRYSWRARLESEKRELSPVLWETYFGSLAVAAPESITRLRQIVNDDAANPRDQIAAARVILSQVVAHLSQLEALMPKPAEDGPSLSDLSTKELVALAAAEGE